MRKYVVPIVALVGIALLSPRSDAANLIIKSRLGVAGRPVSVPVAVTGVSAAGGLWGLDFALTFDTTRLTVGTDPGGNGSAFSPMTVTGNSEVPVVVSGTTFVGTVAPNPSLYVGIVRGTGPFTTSATSNAPTWSIGLLRLGVASTVPTSEIGTVLNLVVPSTGYNVANTGDGSTTNNRAGTTGATSDVTAGAPVVAETMTVLDTHPGPGAIHVPLHKIAIGYKPGDVLLGTGAGAGKIDSGDLSRVQQIILQKRVGTDYELIAADVSNTNTYVPVTAYGGTNGLSYGDGTINSADLTQLKKYILTTATNFPVSE